MTGTPLSPQHRSDKADGHFDLHLEDPDEVVRADPGDLGYVRRGVTRPLRNSAGRTSGLLGVLTPGGISSPRSSYGIDFCRDGPYNRRLPDRPGRSRRTFEATTTHNQERDTACEQ